MNELTPASATEAEAARQVYRWLIEGQRPEDIEEALRSQYPNYSASELINAALTRFASSAQCDTDALIGWSFEAIREIYRRCLAGGDNAGAMRAVKELLALEAATRYVREPEQEA